MVVEINPNGAGLLDVAWVQGGHNAQWATMCQFGKNEFYNWENTGDSFKTTVILQSLRKCISFFI